MLVFEPRMAQSDEQDKKTIKSPIAEREEATLAFWRERDIFQKTLDKKSLVKDGKEWEFIFYDGPPFATGEPHYGHILAGTIKDVIPRYKTMCGFHVPRRWGWDCHGLPIENLIEKELGLSTRKDIEMYGIEKFNAAARASVLRYDTLWKEIIPRTGRFVDMDHSYVTMDWRYTESIWWSFSELNKKELVYQGFKPMHLCPRCETTLSNFEVGLNYKEVTDISVYVKFELVDEPGTFLLAWTTTPWTLPGNVALAVNPKIKYVRVKIETEKGTTLAIVANERLSAIKETYTIEEEFSGKKIVGKKYKPVFPYYENAAEIEHKENFYTVQAADFVTTEDGTGVVHIAPGFGEDDYNLSQTAGLPFIQHVGVDGRFKKEVTDFAGQQVKPRPTAEEPNAHQRADVEIIKYLAAHGALFAKEKITHSYPHCWRCDTPLLNYATSSWFVKVADIKKKLVAENKKVRWVPEEIGQGRFGMWLENARDWAVSRSRFWGAPLPVWRCEECGTFEFIDSVKTLSEKLKRNEYFLMRHGQAESNVANVIVADEKAEDPLTAEGEQQAADAAKKFSETLAGKKIDAIFSSPFERTHQTAEIVARELGFEGKIEIDERLRELGAFAFEGESREKRNEAYREGRVPSNDETQTHEEKRIAEFFHDIDARFKGKTILVVSHAAPLAAALRLVEPLGEKSVGFMDNAEIRPLPFVALPHDAHFNLDLHRPYIDAVEFACSKENCRGTMKRVPDVFDTWYESGSMPFASIHFPFEQKSSKKPPRFPADFIAEGQDQTRGWFYTLLILNTALFGHAPYKNVVVNGIILAEDGQKMSKRLKNYPDIRFVLDKYGADALRYYLLSSPVVEAEDLAFSEKGLDEVVKKVINRLDNVYAFYALYADKNIAPSANSPHVLDRWILAALSNMLGEVTGELDNYRLDAAARPFAQFVDDLSTWYIRRSRDRFKNTDTARDAIATTRFVLRELAKGLAPFMPFLAEDLYQKVKMENDQESVHLERWSDVSGGDQKLLTAMNATRTLVSLALEKRAAAGIKIRQPLGELSVNDSFAAVADDEGLAELVRDEVNVKKIFKNTEQAEPVVLNTAITPELKNEGIAREFIRSIQDLRKNAGLRPNQEITLIVETASAGRKIIETHAADIRQVIRAKKILFKIAESATNEFSIDDFVFKVRWEL